MESKELEQVKNILETISKKGWVTGKESKDDLINMVAHAGALAEGALVIMNKNEER